MTSTEHRMKGFIKVESLNRIDREEKTEVNLLCKQLHTGNSSFTDLK